MLSPIKWKCQGQYDPSGGRASSDSKIINLILKTSDVQMLVKSSVHFLSIIQSLESEAITEAAHWLQGKPKSGAQLDNLNRRQG